MDVKRVLTAVLGLPIVLLVIIFGNEILMNVVFTAIAIICMHEYLGAIGKIANPIKWIAYLSTLSMNMIWTLLFPTTSIVMSLMVLC